MELAFATQKLSKLCSSMKEMRIQLGPRCAQLLAMRLSQLEAASTLEDVRYLPKARCHELKGDRKGELAVDLEHSLRLIFVPDHQPQPTKVDGGLDWRGVTKILILEIKDYH